MKQIIIVGFISVFLLNVGCANQIIPGYDEVLSPTVNDALKIESESTYSKDNKHAVCVDLSKYSKHERGLLYTNLVGDEVQNIVRHILLDAGADEDSLSDFFEWVNQYNTVMRELGSMPLVSEFTQIDMNFVFYDLKNIAVGIRWADVGYRDIFCRMVAFHLLRPIINIQNLLPEVQWYVMSGNDDDFSRSTLFGDLMVFQDNPYIEWPQYEISRYFTLFNPVMLYEDVAEDELHEVLLTMWKERGVTFVESKLSLVSIWRINEYNEFANSHAAVLAELNNGLLLVEKTNPYFPYQALFFNNISEVKSYLVEQLASSYLTSDTDTYIVMRNDELVQ